MAVDYVLFLEFLEGGPPTWRFYGFKEPSVTIGKLQRKVPRQLLKFPIARRPTGGRAVLHDGDLVFSLVASWERGYFAGSVLETYRKTSEIWVEAAKALGVPVEMSLGKPTGYSDLCFESTSRYEITLEGKKVVGIAQMREQGAFLEQGSVYIPAPREALMEEVFKALARRGLEPRWARLENRVLRKARELEEEFVYESAGGNSS